MHRTTRAPYYTPVVNGRVRMDLGVFHRKAEAQESARIAAALTEEVVRVEVCRVWVRKENNRAGA